jgi:hypothetical protein
LEVLIIRTFFFICFPSFVLNFAREQFHS